MSDAAVAPDPGPPCTHPDIDVKVSFNRIQPDPVTQMPAAFVADFRVNCVPPPQGCGVAFMFPGVPLGVSYDEPRASIDGSELRAPIRPVDAPPEFGTGFPSVAVNMYVANDEPGCCDG